MKRFSLSSSVCLLIVLSILAVGCVPAQPMAAEPDELMLELMIAPEGVFGDITAETYSMQLLAERTGFNFAFRQIPREFLGERIATTLASGDLPDIMQLGVPADSTGTPMDIAHQFGPQGLFVSLSEYIEAGKMPNLAAEMERQPDMGAPDDLARRQHLRRAAGQTAAPAAAVAAVARRPDRAVRHH